MLFIAPFVLLAAAAQVRVAIPSLSAPEMGHERGLALVDYFAEQLAKGGGIQVSTPSDIRAVLGNERQKALLGCSDDSSCLAELTSALGAEYLVIGSVAKVGAEMVATLKCLRARNGEVRGSWSARVREESQLLDFLASSAKEVRRLLLPQTGASPLRVLPVVAGGVLLAGGAALFGYAWSQQQRLVRGDAGITSAAQAMSVASTGRSLELAGWALWGVGLGLLALGLFLTLSGVLQ